MLLFERTIRRLIVILALCLLILSSNNIGFSDSVTNCKSFDSCTSSSTQNGTCYVNINYTKCDNSPSVYSPACLENSCRHNCACSCGSDNTGGTSYYNSCTDRVVLANFICSGCASGAAGAIFKSAITQAGSLGMLVNVAVQTMLVIVSLLLSSMF